MENSIWKRKSERKCKKTVEGTALEKNKCINESKKEWKM